MRFRHHHNAFHLWVGAALAGLLAVGCQNSSTAHAQSPGGRPAPQVAVITAAPQRIVLTTELPGRTSAYRVADIRPQVNGLIQKRMFTEGAIVNAGDLLYQIDPEPYLAALANAKAALARAEAVLPAYHQRVDRYEELLADKAVSQQDYDDAASALRQGEADVQYWKASLTTARINLAYTRITAPISGRIGRSEVTEGAIVTAYQPQALATIKQMDPIYVDVPQSTASLLRLRRRLAAGQLHENGKDQKAVRLIMDDGTPYPHDGTLQFTDVTVDPTTGSVTLRIVVPNPDSVLLPGMFLRAVMTEGVNPSAILIPQQAVSRDPRGNPLALLVDADNKVVQRQLTLDRAVGSQWLVAAGITAGDRVIVEGVQKVRPGVSVTTVPFTATAAKGVPERKAAERSAS